MVVVDTNILVRFFRDDIQVQADKARLLLQSESVLIPESVIAEFDFVMEKVYLRSRLDVATALGFLLGKSNIHCPKVLPAALELFSHTSLHIVDCLAAAHARGKKLATFDKKLLYQSKAIGYWKVI